MLTPRLVIKELHPFAKQPEWKIQVDTKQSLYLVYGNGKCPVKGDDLFRAGYLAPGQKLNRNAIELAEKANVCITRKWYFKAGRGVQTSEKNDTPLELMTLGDVLDWTESRETGAFYHARSLSEPEDDFKADHPDSMFALETVRALIPRLIEVGLLHAELFMHNSTWNVMTVGTVVRDWRPDDELEQVLKTLKTLEGCAITLNVSVVGESFITISRGDERLYYRWATFLL